MKQTETGMWQPDATQQQIIGLDGGCHLVLAPPGCGKTQILTERIRRAHARGVAYGDMLCLTFTNRAARGMRERIQEYIDDTEAGEVFVGNVHRFCSRFLFENQIVPAESAIIDDDTTLSIMADYFHIDLEDISWKTMRLQRECWQAVLLSHLMVEVRHGIGKPLRLHPESMTREDVAVIRTICQLQGREFTSDALMDVYDHNDFYQDFVQSDAFPVVMREQALQTLTKMKYAHAYEAYKRQNNLLDFEDLLEQTYIALSEGPQYKRYAWIQVDEVQDLSPLQLAIIDRLSTLGVESRDSVSDPALGTMVYLGDEMQAIFSFMGAKLQILDQLKERCAGQVHHLGVNYRSPKYLVDLFNAYAARQLRVSDKLLPQSKDGETGRGDELRLVASGDRETECHDAAKMAADFYARQPDESTAIIVTANWMADRLSQILTEMGMAHFKVSGQDLFTTPGVTALMSHLCVLDNDRNFLAWARLMVGMKVCKTAKAARELVRQLEMRAIVPTDFFEYADSTRLQHFLQVSGQEELVVFDTETTGLDVFEDDIVQIAAEKIRAGRSIGKFSVHIQTDRHIPEMLGDVPNPIIEERRHQHLYAPAEALRMFLDFVGDRPLLAHNAKYDYHIMDYNLRRYLPEVKWQPEHPVCFDSLQLIRLLRPDLKAYKLRLLLQELGLEGENSHLADDDVHATVSLVNYCCNRGQEVVDSQKEFLGRKTVQEHIRLLRKNYGPIYAEGRRRLYDRLDPKETPALVAEMQRVYGEMRNNGWVGELPKLNYLYRFLATDIIDSARERSLAEQLSRHIMELTTFKEADLCGASTIDDRIFVTTIHKAKGLEFDNVIVFDIIDGVLPNGKSVDNARTLEEEARKLYVAMTRARKRLVITYCLSENVRGMATPRQLSRFLEPVKDFFKP